MGDAAAPRQRDNRATRTKIGWKADELAEVKERAKAARRPFARYVRECALGAAPRPATAAAAADALTYQLGRIGNNLNQLAYWANITEELPAEEELRALLDELNQIIKTLR